MRQRVPICPTVQKPLYETESAEEDLKRSFLKKCNGPAAYLRRACGKVQQPMVHVVKIAGKFSVQNQ